MPTVLVVDDTAVDRRLAGGLLGKASDVEVIYAENGNDALKQIESETPDLVLTDLQMPDLDGLQLVNTIGERFSEVPVVLMTAHGSEVIAAQALASGAASYVPKSELADNLVETVMHILAMSDSDARYKKLMRCARKVDFEFALENDIRIIEPLIDLVQQVVSSQDLLDSTDRVRTGVAVEHAVQNAMLRGNLEMSREAFPVATSEQVIQISEQPKFRDRRVHFRFTVNQDGVEFIIHDDGRGFDLSTLPQANAPESFRDGIGRGLVLIQAFMDDVEFSENGSRVVMKKHRSVN